jgi:type IV pilus assembly protein PilE
MNKTVSLGGLKPRVHGQRGITLIELLIAMVIVSILAAIAIPSYSSYIMKSRRTEAKSALLGMAALEERFYSTNNSYSGNASDLGYAAGTTPPFLVGSGYYNITTLTAVAAVAPASSTSVGTPATYTITATPTGSQANDSACSSFTINSGGVQTSTCGGTCW